MLQSLAKLRVPSWTCRQVVNLRWYSDDDKPSKKEKSKTEKPKRVIKNEDSINKLNSLLESMSARNMKTDVKIVTAPKKKKVEEPTEDLVKDAKHKNIMHITETIAKKIGGDVKQNQTELLSKLLGTKDLKSAGSLVDVIAGLKVEDEQPKQKLQRKDERREYQDQSYSRADNVRRSMGRDDRRPMGNREQGQSRERPPRRTEAAPMSGVVNLFAAEPLNIFHQASKVADPLKTWSALEQRELKLAVTHPPKNYFEKMIMWTEQGKLWKFPIDNEQGMEEEASHDFSEHVLLEMYLDDWCPNSGPVRHFMELVCVGLSKNNFLTAVEKKNHIMWYRDYFEEKKNLLGDLMSMGKVAAPEQPQVEA